jgi:hypothetical protein
LALSGSACAAAVDKEFGLVRARAGEVSGAYKEAADAWAVRQEQYLKDLQDFIGGVIAVEPESPGPPPESPGVDKFPSSLDYNKAFGDSFLRYVCENVVVDFDWDGRGVDVRNGRMVSDPVYPAGFSVLGASGGGVFSGPGPGDVSRSDVFLNELSTLVSALEVTLPAIPGATTFTPVVVNFEQGAKLESSFSPKPGGDEADYESTLLGLCEDLITSFKQNFKSVTGAVHKVASMPYVPSGFIGQASMSSIS